MLPSLTPLRFLFFQAVLAYAAPHFLHSKETQVEVIKWSPCFGALFGFMCGNVSVPLDYSDPNLSETLTITLLKAPAAQQPSRGSILFNFGGPGGGGRDHLAGHADIFHALTGGYHDLVSFDPRGTGDTMPFSCHGKMVKSFFTSMKNPLIAGNSSITALTTLWGMAQVTANACQENSKDIGRLVGTTFTARDMMRIVDALEEDGLLRYWGFSYGTVLGATVAAMFPERMDKLVLDGVVNIHEYYRYQEVELFTDSDNTLSAFLYGCVAVGEEKCALARHNATASDLEETVYECLDDLKYKPIPYGGGVLDYFTFKRFIFERLKAPTQWSNLTILLDGLLVGNLTVLDESSEELNGSLGLPGGSLFGIQCGDKISRASHPNDVLSTIEQVQQKSRLVGDVSAWLIDICALWKMDAKERYQGDFLARTKNPILLIGNTHDPITPLVSAYNASESLGNAVVLQQNGSGHSSFAQPSMCTANAVRAYFVEGIVPKHGTICEVDVPLFSHLNWRAFLHTD